MIASSDDHKCKGGVPDPELYPDTVLEAPDNLPCITGVWAEENTTEAIFDALKARRCYGFMGGRISLDFRINGHFMGEVITLNKDEDRVIYWNCQCDSPIDKITLVKNCRDDLILRNPRGVIFDYSPELPVDCYYLRVITRDNRWCWSSPIWVRRK